MNETTNVGLANTTKIICHETDVPTRLSYNLTDGATTDVDLVTGELIVTTPIIPAEDSVMGIPVSYIMRQKKIDNGVTRTSHLSVEERLEKVEDENLSYIYTDAKGDRYGFTEVYYTLNGDARVIVEKADVTIDVDGTMHETNSGKEVFCEYVSVTGLRLSAPKFNLKGIHLLEQRSDEQKQLEEQIESYENAIKDYVLLDKSLCVPSADEYATQREKISTMACITEGELFDNGLGDNALLVTRSEAVQYYQFLEQQKGSIEDRYINVIPDVTDIQFSLLQYERQFYDLQSKLITIVTANVDSITEQRKNLLLNYLNKTGSARTLIPAVFFTPVEDNDIDMEPFQTDAYYATILPGTEYMRGEDVRNLFYQRNMCLYQIWELQENIENSKQNVTDTIAILENKAAINLRIVQNYFRTLESLNVQLKTMKRQSPTQFLSDGNIIRGFNELGQLVMVMDEYEQYATLEYDEDVPTRLNGIVSEAGKSVEFSYDGNGNISTITDAKGGRITLSWDDGLIETITFPDKGTFEITYVSDGSIRSLKGRDRVKWSIVSYSDTVEAFSWLSTAGQFDSTTTEGNANVYMQRITIEHQEPQENGEHQVWVYKDGTPFMDVYIFDENNHLKEYWRLDYGSIIEAKRYNYQQMAGNVFVKTVQEADKSCLYVMPNLFEFVEGDYDCIYYNKWHLPVERVKNIFVTTNERARQVELTEYVRNAYQQLTATKVTTIWATENEGEWNIQDEKVAYSIYEYNARGKVVRTRTYVEGEENTLGVTVEETVYDDKGSVVETMTYNSLNPTMKFCTRQDVSPEGQVVATYDESGEHKTVTSYQADGTTVREQILPNGSKFAYGFDDESRSVSISQSTSVGEENSTVKRYTYGMVTELCSGNNVVQYSYDSKRRLSSVTLNGHSVVDYAYNTEDMEYNGRLCEECTIIFPNNYRTKVIKDAGGDRVHQTQQFYGNSTTPICTTTFTYDEHGNLLNRAFTKGSTTEEETYDYRDTDVISSYTHKTNGAEDESETFTYDYTGALLQRTETVGTSKTTYAYTYKDTLARELDCIAIQNSLEIRPKTDLLGRYVGKTLSLCGSDYAIMRDKITYRKIGDHATNQVSSMSFKDGTFFNYTYDEMGNITTVCENGELVVRYTYDDLCRLVREDNKKLDKTVVFVYDNNGNILVRREYGFTLVNQETLACTTEVPTTYPYVYEGDQLIYYDGKVCDYTPIGCTDTYLGKAMDWDKDGRLSACYAKDGNKVLTFTYDSHGRRISKGFYGETPITFIYNKDGNLIYQNNGTDTMQFLYDHTGVAGLSYRGQTYFYRKNAQGDIIAIDNGSNKPVVNYIYDAWGNHRIVDENGVDIDENSPYNEIAQANPFRYRSYYFDTETGFYYLPARYYDPSICRFISRDDHSYLDPESINGLNLYAYCLNNPVMNFDPTGHFVLTTAMIIGAVAGAILGGIYGGISAAANNQNILIGVLIGAVVGGATGFFAEALSGIALIASTFAVGFGGDVASQVFLEGKSLSEINLVSATLAGFSNTMLSYIGKNIPNQANALNLPVTARIVYGAMISSPSLAMGMALNMTFSQHAPVYTVNNLRDDILRVYNFSFGG